MRAAVYLRQSLDRSGDGLGVDRQREDVRSLIEARGWTLAAEFVDNDVSALSRKPRPQFSAMMARVDAGEFDVIVARHMDRLLRRLAELENTLERCQAAGVAIVTASDGVDTSTDGGRLVARILSSVAQGEVERKGARQRSAAIQAAKAGRWVGGRRPFGYEKDGVTICESEAAMIKQAYVDVLAGETVSEIARRWNASGVTPAQSEKRWYRGTVKDVLTNPRHAGLRRYRTPEERAKIRQNPELGIVGKAEWPAIVDETTWRAAVRILTDPARLTGRAGAKGLLTGVALCGVCGQTVHRGGAVGRYPMYRCISGRHVSRQAGPVDDYVMAVAVERLLQPDAAGLWAPELPDADELMAEADKLRRERDGIDDDRAEGIIDRVRWRTMNERINGRLGEIEAKLAAAGSSSPLSIVASGHVEETWSTLSVAQRRNIIAALMTPVLHMPGRGTRTFRPETVEIRWKATK
ncbi:recombinase family protein [Mycobacterium sp. 050272]|uniref:recombinase family protein n=1 Tax=Mycobacterium sp. 050272 TaxID=3142488 RepID=UPI0031937499